MTNLDYPDNCDPGSPDSKKCGTMDQHKLHETYLSPEGYTRTLIKDLQDAMPDKFGTLEDAAQAYDVLKTLLVNGLKNRDAVELIGIGEFRSESKGKPGAPGKTIVFTPDPMLMQGVNE